MGIVYPPAVYDPLSTRLGDLHPFKLGIGMSFRCKAGAFYDIDFIHILICVPALNHIHFGRYLILSIHNLLFCDAVGTGILTESLDMPEI